jgi:hypothetical protein
MMNEMKFVVYGIEVHSPVKFPISVSSEGVYDQVLRLEINTLNHQETVFEYQTPAVEIHGRQIQLFSNVAFSSSRISDERQWQVNVEGLFSFSWSNVSDIMSVKYENELNLEKLSFWLLHTIIPIYLTLKQSSLLLHASVVEVENKAIFFVAPSFGGKSTLADFFVKQKHSLLSDDKVRLEFREKNYLAFPSYPYRRPYREFEKLGDHTEYFSHKPLSLGNIYVLNYVEPQDDCSIETISGLHKFEVLKNAYLYEPVSMSKIEMEYLLNLVQHSVVYQVKLPKDITKLTQVYRMIIAHSTNGET